MSRCGWAGPDEIYIQYHDVEWGVPIWDSQKLWESLMLEAFQAGLSWITILKRREAFRQAFAGFTPEIVAQWGPQEVEALLQNQGIIRHRGKIEATITAAQAYLRLEAAEGFSHFLWKHQGGQVVQTNRADLAALPAQTAGSLALSKALKAEGFKFVGPTIVYAFMQAVGMVNDHVLTCPCHAKVAQLPQSGPAAG